MTRGYRQIASVILILQAFEVFGFEYNHSHYIEAVANLASVSFELDALKDVVQSIRSHYEHPCFDAILRLYDGNTKVEQLRFFDSWAKLTTGLLEGTKLSVGNFQECLEARKEYVENGVTHVLKGRYSQVMSYLILPPASQIRKNATYLKIARHMLPFLEFGICLPHVCAEKELNQIFRKFGTINDLMRLFGKRTNNSEIGKQKVVLSMNMLPEQPTSLDFQGFLGICVFSTLLLVVLSSTLYEHIVNASSSKYHRLAVSFSLINNSKQLFKISPYDESSSATQITCVTGIRVLSTVLVIYGHSFLWATSFIFINYQTFLNWLISPLGMTVMSAGSGVDTFFLIAGALVTFNGLRKLQENKGRLNAAMMFLHRYIRMAPTLYFMVLLHLSGLLRLLYNGPYWDEIVRRPEEYCRHNWWITALFINNYLNSSDICVSSAWFLAVDMQLYLLAPFILYGFYKYGAKVVWFLLGLIIASQISTLVEMTANNLNTVLSQGITSDKQITQIYYRTHHRCIPWLIGTMLGTYLHHQQNGHQRFPKYMVPLLWLISIAIMLANIFGPVHLADNPSQASPLEAAAYEALGRTSWSLAIAWIIISCHQGYTPKIDDFLSYPGWQPLDRLSLTLLLTSTTIQTISIGANLYDVYFSPFKQFQLFCSEYLLSILMSVMVSVMVERPFMNIEAVLIRR